MIKELLLAIEHQHQYKLYYFLHTAIIHAFRRSITEYESDSAEFKSNEDFLDLLREYIAEMLILANKNMMTENRPDMAVYTWKLLILEAVLTCSGTFAHRINNNTLHNLLEYLNNNIALLATQIAYTRISDPQHINI